MATHDPVAREALVTVHGAASGFAQTVVARSHQLTVDEPLEFGGADTGPTPYELLASALGT